MYSEVLRDVFVLGGGGGGGYLTKFNTGRLLPKVQPLTLLYTILAEKIPLLLKKVPLHIPSSQVFM